MRQAVFLGTMLMLTGCGSDRAENTPRAQVEAMDSGGGAPDTQFGFREAMASPMAFESGSEQARAAMPMMESPASAQQPAGNAQQIAYSYDYGFQVDADELTQLQLRHIALCDELGNACRVLNRASSGNADYGYGNIRMEVEAARARAFGESLAEATEGLDAEQISIGVSGEDLTKSISDSEAHLAGRRLLRERLMEILRTRQGSVGDLVEAERAVAEVNEEIDAAASNLALMRGRVAFSTLDITYDPELGEYTLGFLPPIKYAISTVGTTLGMTIAALIYLVVALIPITGFVLLLRWLWRKSGLRLWRRKPKVEEAG